MEVEDYNHEPKPAMTQPQSPDDELKRILHQTKELLRASHEANHKNLENWAESVNLCENLRIRAETAEAENKLCREDLAKHEAEIVRLNKAIHEWSASYERLRSELKQPPSPEPAWVPAFHVGQQVRIKGTEIQAPVFRVPNRKGGFYELENGKGSWLEMNLEPIPWSLTPPPFGKWHREDWTQDMLPEGWRSLIFDEIPQKGDEWRGFAGDWNAVKKNELERAKNYHYHTRTKRPLPSAPEDPAEKAWIEWTKEGRDFTAKSHFLAGWNARSEGV